MGVALTSSALLCGCATEVQRRYPSSQGWQAVTVVKSAGEFPPPLRPTDDCRGDAKLATSQDQRFAEAIFWSHGFVRHRIVALPQDAAVKVGDRFYVNMLDCSIQALSP